MDFLQLTNAAQGILRDLKQQLRRTETITPVFKAYLRMQQAQLRGRYKMFNATRDDITGFDPSRKTSGRIGIELLPPDYFRPFHNKP